MEWEFLAPMAVAIVLIVTTGLVVLLRPLSKRLGELLEVMVAERREPQLGQELARVRELQELLGERLTLMEERQEFMDQLLRSPEAPRLRAGSPSAGDPEHTRSAQRGIGLSSESQR
jgi:hypothetical protein